VLRLNWHDIYISSLRTVLTSVMNEQKSVLCPSVVIMSQYGDLIHSRFKREVTMLHKR
jgi:hypothetical protein